MDLQYNRYMYMCWPLFKVWLGELVKYVYVVCTCTCTPYKIHVRKESILLLVIYMYAVLYLSFHLGRVSMDFLLT